VEVDRRVGGMDISIADCGGSDDDEVEGIEVGDSETAHQAWLVPVVARAVPRCAIVVAAVTSIVCRSMRRAGWLPAGLFVNILATVMILREIALDQLNQT
jgi:hypothetical protein